MLLCTKETFNAYETLKLEHPYTSLFFLAVFLKEFFNLLFQSTHKQNKFSHGQLSLCLKASQFPETAGFY